MNPDVVFTTDSDCEILLHLYKEYGPDFLSKVSWVLEGLNYKKDYRTRSVLIVQGLAKHLEWFVIFMRLLRFFSVFRICSNPFHWAFGSDLICYGSEMASGSDPSYSHEYCVTQLRIWVPILSKGKTYIFALWSPVEFVFLYETFFSNVVLKKVFLVNHRWVISRNQIHKIRFGSGYLKQYCRIQNTVFFTLSL